jgi:DNA-binding XRE family transcriptional regulator
MARILHFPDTFRALRVRSGLMQKTAAQELNIDPVVLCSVENGTRAPLDADAIALAVDLFRCTDQEKADLSWAAHHDRLVRLLGNRGASVQEIELVSVRLTAWHHLHSDQRESLVASVRRIGESAKLVSTLSSTFKVMEANIG